MTGNLTSRNLYDTEEHFFYDTDGLNRLTGAGPDANTVSETYTFADNGNITSKAGVGPYQYHNVKKNAVTQIDFPTMGTSPIETQSVTYNHFNSASAIVNMDDQLRVNLEYGPDDQRRMAKYWDDTGAQAELIKTRIYAGSYEKQINPDLSEIEIHYITAGGMLVAMYVIEDGVGAYYYPHLDHLGSIIHVTDETGTITYTQSFDAWGRTRNADDHSYSNIAPRPDWLWRGYTGHEHLDEFGLINMNGRLYDPVVGRMLSPDNYVQSPDFTQSYNRYSYVWNNPLKYTDPSGENVFDAFERFLDVLFSGFKAINEGVSWVNDRINNSPRDTYFRKGYLLEGELPYPVLANNGLPPSQTINVDGSNFMGGQVGSAGFTDAAGRHYANSQFERWLRQWEQEIKNAAAKSVPAQRQKVIEKVDPYVGGGPLMASLDGYIGTEPEKQNSPQKDSSDNENVNTEEPWLRIPGPYDRRNWRANWMNLKAGVNSIDRAIKNSNAPLHIYEFGKIVSWNVFDAVLWRVIALPPSTPGMEHHMINPPLHYNHNEPY